MTDAERNELVVELADAAINALRPRVGDHPMMLVEALVTALARVVALHPQREKAVYMATILGRRLPSVVGAYYDLETRELLAEISAKSGGNPPRH